MAPQVGDEAQVAAVVGAAVKAVVAAAMAAAVHLAAQVATQCRRSKSGTCSRGNDRERTPAHTNPHMLRCVGRLTRAEDMVHPSTTWL